MRFSKFLTASALFHVAISAAVLNPGEHQHHGAVRKRGGSCKPRGGSPDSQGSGNSHSSQASIRVAEAIKEALADPKSGMNVVLPDEEYKKRGEKALKMNEDAIKANPRVDKEYPALKDSYTLDIDPLAQPYDLDSINTILARADPGLDATEGWTYVDARSKGEDDETRSTFIGYVHDNGKTIIASNSYSSNDINTGAARLPNSEIMYQSLELKGNPTSNLENVIRTPIANAGSLTTMEAAVKANFGDKAKLTNSYSFKPTDGSFNSLVGDYWTSLNGLDNTRPQSFMAADHPVAMNNLKITEIIVWPKLPTAPLFGGMLVKMGRDN